MADKNSRWEERKKLLVDTQAGLRNQIRGTVTKKQLNDLLGRWKNKKIYISKATQSEATTHFRTLRDF